MYYPEIEQNPYKDLYIYYLQGYIGAETRLAGEGFIGNWEEEGFSFLFFSRSSDDAVHQLIASKPDLKLLDRFHMSYDQWHGGDDSPLYVGSFAVTPPWNKAIDKRHVEGGCHHILLDPGVVFGTGLHPTTRDCLEAIELGFSRRMPEFVVEIGTGPGRLALAAAKLAGCTTIAVDLNFLSVQTTLKNVMLNQLENKIVPVQGSAENFVDYPADFMIANIHYDITRKILDSKGFYQKKRFLLSGLLKSEAKAVKDQLWQHDVELIKTWDQNGIWFTFLGEIH